MTTPGNGDIPVRHILSLSGGKDSTALAIHMRNTRPDLEMEYVFCDTRKELTETYEYLDRVEAYLGKKIFRLNARAGFDHWHAVFDGYLPSPQMRWCTKLLKLKPFEEFVGDQPVVSYVGIRADEDREGYISHKANIRAVFPFKEDGIDYAGVMRILNDSGIGLPPVPQVGPHPFRVLLLLLPAAHRMAPFARGSPRSIRGGASVRED